MDKHKILKLTLSAKVKEIIETLKQEEENELYLKYVDRYINNRKETFVPQKKLNDLIHIYCNYYKEIFYHQKEPSSAEETLKNQLIEYLNLSSDLSFDEVEKHVQEKFEEKKYYFKGDKTSGVYGPYIWKTTISQFIDVEVPEGVYNIKLNKITDFVHNSWLSYLTFGIAGTGGWATNYEIFCIIDQYKNSIDKPLFQISYLKHEVQHFVDGMNNDFTFTIPVLEYMAKLCELAYYQDTSKLKDFIETANKNTTIPHPLADYWVIHDLSKKIFDREFKSDIDLWDIHLEDVHHYSRKFLLTYTRGIPC